MVRMLRILPLIPVLAAFGLFVASCGTDHAQLRFVHASPNAPNVDITVDSKSFATDIPYASFAPSSGYTSFNSGNRNLQVFVTGTTTNPLIDSNLNLSGGKQYTVLASGLESSIAAVLVTDNNTQPSSGKVNLRVIHDSPSAAGHLDIYLVSPGTDITNITPNASALAYQQASGYFSMTAGSIELIATVTGDGTKTRIIDQTYSLTAGQVRTLVLLDVPGSGFLSPTPLELADLN